MLGHTDIDSDHYRVNLVSVSKIYPPLINEIENGSPQQIFR